MSKKLFDALVHNELVAYGSEFPATFVHEVLGLEFPESAPKRVYDDLSLKELSAIDYVRNILLGQGKYLEANGQMYRICLPSENRIHVERYMKSADKKLKRAGRLSRSTPPSATGAPTQDGVRMHLKQTSRRTFAGSQATPH